MKKTISLIMALAFVFSLAACGGTEENTDEISVPEKVMEDKVFVTDYRNERIVVYDLSRVGEDGNLDGAEVWELKNAYSPAIKYREDTVFGDVVLHTADYTPSIVEYRSQRILWCAPEVAGAGVHSIEMLPSGNVVTACTTDGMVRIFNSANGVKSGESVRYTSYYDLPGAHGVLWDPKYECLWALGTEDLIAYRVKDLQDGTQALELIPERCVKLPGISRGGHDLSADLTDSRYLWITSSKVLRFDKETGTFSEQYENSLTLNQDGVKGFGNNLNRHYFFTRAKGDGAWTAKGNPNWTTDTIHYGYWIPWKGTLRLYMKECVSQKSAFYKVRVFYGKYQ